MEKFGATSVRPRRTPSRSRAIDVVDQVAGGEARLDVQVAGEPAHVERQLHQDARLPVQRRHLAGQVDGDRGGAAPLADPRHRHDQRLTLFGNCRIPWTAAWKLSATSGSRTTWAAPARGLEDQGGIADGLQQSEDRLTREPHAQVFQVVQLGRRRQVEDEQTFAVRRRLQGGAGCRHVGILWLRCRPTRSPVRGGRQTA